MRLQGKTALITGAAKGIGKACAELFVKEGAYVYLSDIEDAIGNELAETLGTHAKYIHLDVSIETDWKQAIDQILQEKKELNILVNNAGIVGIGKEFGPQDPEHASLESWRRVHAINADGTFLGCKYAIRAMKKTNGSIINLSSRSGLVGIPGAGAYASSKASIRNHTKSVALYCCQKGYDIRCNSLHPAAILTPLWDPMLGEGEKREKMLKKMAEAIPMKRLGTAEEVASVALYLASDESSYTTGSEITLDGGLLAGSSAAPGD